MIPHRRVTLAAVLICVAVFLPTAAWYVTGSNEVVRRAETLEDEAEFELRDGLEREAARLSARLDDLRRQESDRPFFHYQTLYHDPRGAAEGLSVTPSPLASGATDPMVWAYFQIDETGLVTLPTVSERFPELGSDADFGLFCSRLEELQNAVVMEDMGTHDPFGRERVQYLTDLEWRQIKSAESVYASITGRHDESDAGSLAAGSPGTVEIRISPLNWQTMVLGSGPILAAMREVHTPDGIVLQGFAIASLGVGTWLGAYPAGLEFLPETGAEADSLTALVGDTNWVLDVAVAEATAPAVAEGRALIRQFRRTFAVTVTAVFLAAGAVVWILLQTDRLARQRARFAAAAAHELKTPLSGLMLHSEMLAENLGDSEARPRYAATVTAEAERLGRVVTNMLDLSRLERGADLAHPRPQDLAASLHRFVDRARPRLEDQGIAVAVSVADDLPPVLFDDDALSQILDNLVDNSEKHTRGIDNRRISVSAVADRHLVRIRVRDNGPGIPRHLRRSVFRPFGRPSQSDGTPGLGLGLAISRSLARAQGGELELAPSDGSGTTFELSLPLASPTGEPTS